MQALALEFPQSLAVYDKYEDAQKAVDFLSDHEFPVQKRIVRIGKRDTQHTPRLGRQVPKPFETRRARPASGAKQNVDLDRGDTRSLIEGKVRSPRRQLENTSADPGCHLPQTAQKSRKQST